MTSLRVSLLCRELLWSLTASIWFTASKQYIPGIYVRVDFLLVSSFCFRFRFLDGWVLWFIARSKAVTFCFLLFFASGSDVLDAWLLVCLFPVGPGLVAGDLVLSGPCGQSCHAIAWFSYSVTPDYILETRFRFRIVVRLGLSGNGKGVHDSSSSNINQARACCQQRN